MKKEYQVPEVEIIHVEYQYPIMDPTGGDDPIPIDE